MRKTRKFAILLMSMVLMIAMSGMASAESYKFSGKCAYNGSEITSNFTSEEFAASQADLEPGDELSYTVTYTNKSDSTTSWYMKNTVLETLEDAKDAAENGGYTYKLVNVGPSGKETVLFDNSEVGGETKVEDLEGLKQATNATGNFFFIQKLKKGETGTTKLYIKLDGETEVNDYMDTKGALMVSYAVENESGSSVEQPGTPGTPRTGDPVNILEFVLIMLAAIVVAILAIFSWRHDRREAAAEGAGANAIAEIEVGGTGGKDGDKA